MIFVLLIIIFVLALAIVLLKNNEGGSALMCGICGLMVVGMVLLYLHIYACENKSDYHDSKYYDNPAYTQNLEALPFKSNASTPVYVSKEKDSWNNDIYKYCVKTENGIDERRIEASVGRGVYIEYIDADEQPYLKIKTKSQEEVLAKKPSFWLNFFGWLEYKDVSIGDVVDDASTCEANYTFYVPQGSTVEEQNID